MRSMGMFIVTLALALNLLGQWGVSFCWMQSWWETVVKADVKPCHEKESAAKSPNSQAQPCNCEARLLPAGLTNTAVYLLALLPQTMIGSPRTAVIQPPVPPPRFL